ncbi:MAG TPA: fibronectin type III domain-containing protein, partial [Candidatus Bathyarchaeia archaeon]|nr:fibronectin type III domain-containing protein [Candidatus Bathyarchaeia archaeon]
MGLALASGPNFLYAADTTPPTAPSNLTASAASGTRINLTWTASTDDVGVTGYRVERCTGVGCTNFAQVTTVTGTTYGNTGLTQATSYSYRVRASDAAGNLSSYSNIASATTRDTTRPTVSAFTIPATATALTVPITSFAATDNVGVTGYIVTESSTAPSATAAGWTAVAPSSYTFATAGSKRLYAWAKDAAGNVSASRSASVTITLQSTGPEPAGWYAGDMHVHRSCGGSPEAVSSLYSKMDPEDLAVISLLADMGNGEVQNPVTDLPLVNGQDASVSTPGRIVHWDAEW